MSGNEKLLLDLPDFYVRQDEDFSTKDVKIEGVSMFKNAVIGVAMVSSMLLSGCASVPMAPKEQDIAMKKFDSPSQDKAGLYIYRNTFGGQALKKTVSVDGVVLGETANKVYFYKEIVPGNHIISTESEFSDNSINFDADGGKNYFAEQYIKIGAFVGGAGIKMIDEDEGKSQVLQCELAK